MAEAKRDGNRVPTLIGVSNIDSLTPIVIEADVPTASLNVNIANDDVGIGGGTEYTEDVATANPQVGKAIMIERDDQLSAVTPVAGDWIGLRGSERGALWVTMADAAGDPITSFGGGTQYTEDDAVPANPVGTAMMMERDDILAGITPAEADWTHPFSSAEGALWTQDFNSDAIFADTTTIAGAVAAGQMQVDIVADGADLLTNTNFAAAFGTAGAADSQVMSVQGVASMTPLSVTESSPISGFATSAHQVTDNAVLDQIELNTDALLVVGGGAEATALRVTIANDSTGLVSVDDNASSLTVDTTGTAGLEVVQTVAADLLCTATLADGDSAHLGLIADPVSILGTATYAETTSKGMLIGVVRNDTLATLVDTDNEITSLQVNATGALYVVASGTSTVDGTVTANLGAVDNAVLDNIALYTGGSETALEKIDGAIVGPGEPTIDSYTHLAINLGVVTDSVLVSSAANKQVWVYGISFVCSVAGTVSFQDEDNTAITGVMPFAANSGLSHPTSGNFAMPIWKLGTDKDLEVDTVTCSIDGWLDYAIVSV